MGRYYDGDIEGKFWFAVQSSNAADRFGVEGTIPQYLEYYFDEENLSEVVQELNKIEIAIGKENLELLNKFFSDVSVYNDKIMNDYHPQLLEIWTNHKSDYADWCLGSKIRKCIEDTGECQFSAEC